MIEREFLIIKNKIKNQIQINKKIYIMILLKRQNVINSEDEGIKIGIDEFI